MPVQETQLRQALQSNLIEHAVDIRNRRRYVEERMLSAHRIWMNSAEESRYTSTDTARTPYNVPNARRAIERTVVRGADAVMPNVKWFEVTPLGNVSDEQLSNADDYMNFIVSDQIKSRSLILELFRCLILYGRCHLQTSVRVINGQVWPYQRAVDPFSLYVYPETCTDYRDAEICFVDYMLSYETYSSFAKRGMVEDLKPRDLGKPTWPYHLVERLAHQAITDPSITRVDIEKDLSATPVPMVSMSLMWIQREDKLFQVYVNWNHRSGPKIVGFVRSRYDQPLYRTVIHRGLPNETYTNSLADDLVDLHYLNNDLLNQFIDAVDREQGFEAIDTAASGGSRMDTWKFKGGAKWEVGGPPRELLNFIQPGNTSNNILKAWQITYGMIQSLAGAGTIAEGQPGRNMPRSGAAVNNLTTLAMADVMDMAKLIEQEALSLGLGDIFRVSEEFIPESQLILIPGAKSLFGKSNLLRKQDFTDGNYQFRWVGSLQFQDEQIRAQRMLIFLNMIPTLAPILQQQGYTFNIVELLQTIWRYSLGERSLSKIVMPITELQKTMSMEEIERNFNSMTEGGQNGSTNGSKPPSSNGSLSYSVPSPTDGFVQQS